MQIELQKKNSLLYELDVLFVVFQMLNKVLRLKD